HEAAITTDGDDATLRVHQLCRHGRGQASAHGGQRVIQQYGVRLVGRVVARKPDLVHAVVEGNDAVVGHHFAHVLDQALRYHREVVVGGAFDNMLLQRIADAVCIGKAPVLLWLKAFLQLPQAVGNVADHLDLWKIHSVDLGGVEVDVHHFGATRAHEKRWLFHHVVTDVDDQVGLVDGAVHEVAIGQRSVADKVWRRFINYALAHLRGHDRDAKFLDKLAQHFRGELAVGGGTEQQ